MNERVPSPDELARITGIWHRMQPHDLRHFRYQDFIGGREQDRKHELPAAQHDKGE